MLRIPTSAINKRLEEGSEISEESSLDDSLLDFEEGSQKQDSTAGISDTSNQYWDQDVNLRATALLNQNRRMYETEFSHLAGKKSYTKSGVPGLD